MKYAWIEDQRDQYPVRTLCRVLGVSTSGFYQSRARTPGPRTRRRQQIAAAAVEAHDASHGVYGYRKVYDDLQQQQIACCLETVRRALRQEGRMSRVKAKFRVTTDSNHQRPVAPNVLDRDFTASAPNQKWATDITYLPTAEGWLYLAVVLDLFSRRVVGWSMGATLQTSLVQEALQMALQQRRPGGGLLHHSDRGSQYASDAYQELLREHVIIGSMSRRGNCWDNAVVESFFGKLKTEWTRQTVYRTREEAKQDVFRYIEVFYNRYRKHAALDYVSPATYESNYLKEAAHQAA